MLLIEAGNVKKSYGDRLIIQFEGLKVYSGDRIGITGQNGSGKTTLMDLLSKDVEPDEGFVRLYCDISYIRQFSNEHINADNKTVSEFSLSNKLDHTVFSGGERTRIKIANALSAGHTLLLADEPTANLDYSGIELLRKKLANIESFILISHDRNLMDSLCNKMIEVRDGRLKLYKGNYSFYQKQIEIEKEIEGREYEKYIAEKISLEKAVNDRRKKSKYMKKTPKRMGNSEARLHKRSTTERQEKVNNTVNSLRTRLEKLEVKEKPSDLPGIKLDFSLTCPPENKIIISAENLNFSYGSKRIFHRASFKVGNGLKTALWGENGCGKSTLLKLIDHKSCESIYIVPRARIGYFHQDFEGLNYSETVLENVMKDSVQNETVVRTMLARLLFSGDDVYKKAGVLSGGEKIRVSFAKLFVSNANVLLLDECTNYLDINSINALESVLCQYRGTVLFVSHDKAFVNAIADRLLIFENHTLKEFEGSLGDYEKSRKNSHYTGEKDVRQMALEMRITEITAMLSRPDADREALEAEYQRLVSRLK